MNMISEINTLALSVFGAENSKKWLSKQVQNKLQKILNTEKENKLSTNLPPNLKRPRNAYNFFCLEQRPCVKKKYPTKNGKEITGELGKLWKKLKTDSSRIEELKYYQKLAEKDKEGFSNRIKNCDSKSKHKLRIEITKSHSEPNSRSHSPILTPYNTSLPDNPDIAEEDDTDHTLSILNAIHNIRSLHKQLDKINELDNILNEVENLTTKYPENRADTNDIINDGAGFNTFSKVFIEDLSTNPELSRSDIIKKLSHAWKSLSQQEKDAWLR